MLANPTARELKADRTYRVGHHAPPSRRIRASGTRAQRLQSVKGGRVQIWATEPESSSARLVCCAGGGGQGARGALGGRHVEFGSFGGRFGVGRRSNFLVGVYFGDCEGRVKHHRSTLKNLLYRSMGDFIYLSRMEECSNDKK